MAGFGAMRAQARIADIKASQPPLVQGEPSRQLKRRWTLKMRKQTAAEARKEAVRGRRRKPAKAEEV